MSKKATTHSGEMHAWLVSHYRLEGLFDGTSQQIVSTLVYHNLGPGQGCHWEKDGGTYIGKAAITVEVATRDEIIASKVQGLKTQKQQVLAEAQQKATKIETEIQSLLAISFDGAEA